MRPVPRILILSASHLWRNPRVLKEATALGFAGYDVTVLSVSSDASFERMDLELARGLPFKRTVIDYASRAPHRRLAHLYQRSVTFAARRVSSLFDIESARSLGPTSALLGLARSHPADLTIVHTEIPSWAAQYLIRDGRRVAIDMEDWYSEDLLTADRRGRPVHLLRKIESFVLNHCAFSFATSQSMANALVAAYRCPAPIVLRNSFPLQRHSRADRPPAAGPPRFIWFSQTIGPGRGLEEFLKAWAPTRKPSGIVLLGHARPDFREHLLATLPHARRKDVAFVPPVTPSQLPSKLAEFDLGLALELRSPRSRDVTITNKILQYMNAGLALIATDTAGQSEVLNAAPGSGLLFSATSNSAHSSRLDELLGNPARLREMQLASRASAEREFCWEHEAPHLINAVDRELSHFRRPST